MNIVIKVVALVVILASVSACECTPMSGGMYCGNSGGGIFLN